MAVLVLQPIAQGTVIAIWLKTQIGISGSKARAIRHSVVMVVHGPRLDSAFSGGIVTFVSLVCRKGS